MIFASVGYKVSIFDIVESQVTTALKQAEAQLKTLEQKGLLRGNFTAAEQFSFIEGCTDLVKALDGAFFLQGELWRWQNGNLTWKTSQILRMHSRESRLEEESLRSTRWTCQWHDHSFVIDIDFYAICVCWWDEASRSSARIASS